MESPKVIKLWFNKDYNLYFPKTAGDCRALMEARWSAVPCFTPPGQTRPGLNSIDQLYGFISSQAQNGIRWKLQLGNYLPSHLPKVREEEEVKPQVEVQSC